MADYSINIRGRLFDLSRPRVMGILNATPDSFYAGSRTQTDADIAFRAEEIISQGGDIIDVGCYSTRPGCEEVPLEEELSRMRKTLEIVRRTVPDAVVSVDTFRAEVAKMAVGEYGADIINDVSGGDDKGEMFAAVAALRVPYILTSVQPSLRESLIMLAASVQKLRDLGQKDIIIDPGFGFGKTMDDNYRLMRQMHKFSALGLPLLVGVSRKSMICKLLGCEPEGALAGTVALNTLALVQGASVLRVHDVREAVDTVRIFTAAGINYECTRNNSDCTQK